jgi:hypothetical protein
MMGQLLEGWIMLHPAFHCPPPNPNNEKSRMVKEEKRTTNKFILKKRWRDF